MIRFKTLSLRHKLTVVIMSVVTVALLLALAAVFLIELREHRISLTSELRSMADLAGATARAAVQFEDEQTASRVLNAFAEDRRVTGARILRADGSELASYRSAGYERGKDDLVTVARAITLRGKTIGTVQLAASEAHAYKRLPAYAKTCMLVFLAVSILALVLSTRLQALISRPILALTDTARAVSRDANYSRRASGGNGDEIGLLVEQFNAMLEQIEVKSRSLAQLNQELEARVRERTRALEESHIALRRSERLAAVGTLAAGVAHEIRNPINSILLAAQSALRYEKNLADLSKRSLETAEKEARRSAVILENVLRFSQEEQAEKTDADINEIMRHSVDIARSYPRNEQASIKVIAGHGLPPVTVNRTEMEQVLINVICNAVESRSEPVAIELLSEQSTTGVRISITDDGPGIPDEVRPHIFDPFFSTKRKHGNTGLGLSLCHRIVADHGGTISVQDKQGTGSSFSIELPSAVRL